MGVSDAIYKPGIQAWACCGQDSNGYRTCDNPTNETFEAEVPSILLASTLGFLSSSSQPSSSQPSSTISTTTTPPSAPSFILTGSTSGMTSIVPLSGATSPATATSSPTGTPSEIIDGSLNAGAKAGIGTGVALGVVLLAILVAGATMLCRRRRAQNLGMIQQSLELPDARSPITVRNRGPYQAEMEARNMQTELEGSGRPYELGYHDSWR